MPLFVKREGETIKVNTRTGENVSGRSPRDRGEELQVNAVDSVTLAPRIPSIVPMSDWFRALRLRSWLPRLDAGTPPGVFFRARCSKSKNPGAVCRGDH